MFTEEYKKTLDGKICPYCSKDSIYVDSEIIYGTSYGMVYLCKDCNAYCGVHKGSDISLGRLAKKELRELKKEAHFYFDQIFKNGHKTRKEAYKWLSEQLQIPVQYTHIGMFDENLCKNTRAYCYLFLKEHKEAKQKKKEFKLKKRKPIIENKARWYNLKP